ncbi:MAG: hypothetical protein GWN16_09565, partial [Calditrichae bacterium]|nr:hypothetical protein [Calditrichia bacterium]NIW79681.1 hypothetical protein [Calditrichia bacterium]
MLSAAIGGISPNILRLAVSLMQENAELPEASYLLGLAIFAVMGAVVALIWKETDLKRAFYLGIGLPAFIQMSAGELSYTTSMAINDKISEHNLVEQEWVSEPAFLIMPASLPQPGPRKLALRFNKFQSRFTVIFISADSSS